jgi:hypothetical protein
MAKAELEDGSIVTLEKECTCIIHRGPCWVHMDKLQRRLNQPLFDRFWRAVETNNYMDAVLAREAIAREESSRLKELRINMERRGIVRLIHEPDDDLPLKQPKRQTRKRKKVEPEITFTGDRVLLTDPITGKPIGA